VLDELGPVEAIADEVTPAPAPVATAGTVEPTDVVLVVLAVVLGAIPTLGGTVLLLMYALAFIFDK
jgi:hypothetical protein